MFYNHCVVTINLFPNQAAVYLVPLQLKILNNVDIWRQWDPHAHLSWLQSGRLNGSAIHSSHIKKKDTQFYESSSTYTPISIRNIINRQLIVVSFNILLFISILIAKIKRKGIRSATHFIKVT
jgi:hypothetical protein